MSRIGQVRTGFTLVEMLTVIFIIALLAGIILPAINGARIQARKAVTSGTISSIDKGCEAFATDNSGDYPQSRGLNPFESGTVYLSGAQWCALQLSGANLQGWVKPERNDTGASPDGRLDRNDWLDWYSNTPSRQFSRNLYFTPDPKVMRSPQTIESSTLITISSALVQGTGEGGSSQWSNARLNFFVDGFGRPILYYRANPYAKQPFTTRSGSNLSIGVYDQSDNVHFTGADANNGETPLVGVGWEVGDPLPATNRHPIGTLGYTAGDVNEPPNDPVTFASYVYDRQIYKTTQTTAGGKIWPLKPDRFLLISPGKDGIWGNLDDVKNFGN